MTRLSLRNPIAILMISLALVIFSAVIVPRMSVDTFPELTPPVLVVGTLAPGLGPKDVEKTITWRIEKYVSATAGVDHVQSVSRNDLSVVFVWLKWGTDLNSAQVLVQQQVAFAMAAVPKSLGVLPPFVLQYDPSNAAVIQIAVSGEGFSGPQLYDYAQNVIEPVIEGIPGVASASPNGGRQRQINVIVDPAGAQARGITSADVAAAVAGSNALLPSGKFITEGFDANVYTNAVPEKISLLGDTVVKLRAGRPVLLRDVARVIDGGAPETQAVAVDGREAVYLNVLRVPGGNTIAIVDAVKDAVATLQSTLPPGMRVQAIFDQSTFVRQSYDGLRKEVLQALVLIALVILLFLQNLRAVPLRRELPAGTVSLVLSNVGSPQNARAAMNSPNAGPHMGFIRLELSDPEHRTLSQRELADRTRKILNDAYPGVGFLQWPGGLVASVFASGYLAPIVVEIRDDSLEDLYEQSLAVAEVARGVPGIVDIYPQLQIDYPEVRIDTERNKAGLVGVNLRGVAQATLEATLGNINSPSVWIDPRNGQSYYVVTALDDHVISDPAALTTVPLRMGEGGRAVTLGAYGRVRRSLGPIAIERNQLERVATVYMQTEGRDLGSTAADLEAKLRDDPRTASLRYHFVGQVDLMRTTFSGLGLAMGLAVMVVFMIMASQFKSLRLPLVLLFTIPVSLVGIVLSLLSAGQGFSIPALMGMLMVVGIAVSNGILLVDAAGAGLRQGLHVTAAVLQAARERFIPIAMTSLATITGLLPTALGLEKAAAANRPLALAVVGGLASSTLLSLFLVPVLFTLLARREAGEPAAVETTQSPLPPPA
jgi:multidrug efflux pump subunit AcrB